jgi:hypothetical protein
MRKPPTLAALFPTMRGDVLAATLTQPEKWWYLSELAQSLGTSPSTLQRELMALVERGILGTRREGTRDANGPRNEASRMVVGLRCAN